MGAVTAILYCEMNEINKKTHISSLVLDSPFTDINSLAEDVSSVQSNIPTVFVSMAMSVVKSTIREKLKFEVDDLRPLESITKYKIPAAFHVGNQDVLVKPHRVKQYFDVCNGIHKKLYHSDCEHGGERPTSFYDKCFRWVGDVFDHEEFQKVKPVKHVSESTSIMKRAMNKVLYGSEIAPSDLGSRKTFLSKPVLRDPMTTMTTDQRSMATNRAPQKIKQASILAPQRPMRTDPSPSVNQGNHKRKATNLSTIDIFQTTYNGMKTRSSRSGNEQNQSDSQQPDTTLSQAPFQPNPYLRVHNQDTSKSNIEDFRQRMVRDNKSPNQVFADRGDNRKKTLKIFESEFPHQNHHQTKDSTIPKNLEFIQKNNESLRTNNYLGERNPESNNLNPYEASKAEPSRESNFRNMKNPYEFNNASTHLKTMDNNTYNQIVPTQKMSQNSTHLVSKATKIFENDNGSLIIGKKGSDRLESNRHLPIPDQNFIQTNNQNQMGKTSQKSAKELNTPQKRLFNEIMQTDSINSSPFNVYPKHNQGVSFPPSTEIPHSDSKKVRRDNIGL